MDALDLHHLAPVLHHLGGEGGGQHRVVGAAGLDPALDAGEQVGGGLPHDPGHGQVGHLQDGLDDLNVLDDHAQAAAHVDEGDHDAGALLALKHQTGGGLAVADAQGVDLDAGLFRRDGGAHLQHVGPQRDLLAGLQVIGVVLHEQGAALQALGHLLHDGGHAGHLPVALAAVADAVGHHVLAGQAGELLHAVQVLEVVDEGLSPLPLQDLPHGHLFLGLVAHGVHIVGGEVIAVLVLRHLPVDLRLGDGVHGLHQMAHRPVVHLPAQLDLGLHLVALGDGHVPHVVAEADDPQFMGEGIAHRRPHPGGQLVLHRLVLPVAGDDLPGQTHPGPDEAVLPVAVGGLVQVHEVHVDLLVGDLPVVLGGQMAVGLLQQAEAVNPHLAGGEGVAPGDDAAAVLVVVGVLHHLGDLRVGLDGGLVHHLAGQVSALVQSVRHLGGPLGHGLQHLGAVQELAAYHKPEFAIFHIHGK